MYLGKWPNTLSVDAKTRIAVPAKFRVPHMDDEGTVEFMIGILQDRCIYLHTQEQHQRFWDRINPHLGDTRVGRRLKTWLLSRFAPSHCDAQGRITLGANLVEEAGIKKDVWLISQESRLEIWGEEELKKLEKDVRSEGIEELLEAVFAEEQREQREKRAAQLHGTAPQGGDREGKTSG